MFVNPFAMSAKKRYEKRLLRGLKQQYNKLSTRSKAIFDKFFVAPEDVPGANKVRVEIDPKTRIEYDAATGEPLGPRGMSMEAQASINNPEARQKEYRNPVSRLDDIKAYDKAFAALSKQIKKGKIAFAQEKKMGRRPAKQAESKLKIKAQAPGKTPSSATGRYTPTAGRNVLKIRGGVN